MKMNINTKTGIAWMACLMLGLAIGSCSSDADEPENNDGRKLRQLTITDVPMTRATLTDNGKTLGASWKEGDKATYFNLSSYSLNEMNYGPLTAATAAETSTFTGMVTCKASDYIALVYPENNTPTTGADRGRFTISLVGQKGTLSDIAERYHYLYGVAQVNMKVDDTAVASISYMKPLLAVCKLTFTDTIGNPIPVTTLSICYGEEEVGYPKSASFTPTQNPDNLSLTTPAQEYWAKLTLNLDTETSDGVYVALLPCDNKQFFFSVTGSNGTYTGTASAKLAAGKYYPVTLKLNKAN